MKLGNACHCNDLVEKDFINKMNKYIKEQSGKFIRTLLATLAGSLLPSLISGNGLQRAEGLTRAGSRDWLSNGISNFDIDNYFNKRVAFPKDKLEGKIKPNEIFVVNLDDSDKKGSHWVAIKNSNGYSLCFDSYGLKPTDEIIRFADEAKFKVIYNTYRIQSFPSTLCGLFSIDFLKSVHDRDSYLNWLLNYSASDFKGNDRIVMKRLNLN